MSEMSSDGGGSVSSRRAPDSFFGPRSRGRASIRRRTSLQVADGRRKEERATRRRTRALRPCRCGLLRTMALGYARIRAARSSRKRSLAARLSGSADIDDDAQVLEARKARPHFVQRPHARRFPWQELLDIALEMPIQLKGAHRRQGPENERDDPEKHAVAEGPRDERACSTSAGRRWALHGRASVGLSWCSVQEGREEAFNPHAPAAERPFNDDGGCEGRRGRPFAVVSPALQTGGQAQGTGRLRLDGRPRVGANVAGYSPRRAPRPRLRGRGERADRRELARRAASCWRIVDPLDGTTNFSTAFPISRCRSRSSGRVAWWRASVSRSGSRTRMSAARVGARGFPRRRSARSFARCRVVDGRRRDGHPHGNARGTRTRTIS